MKYCNRCGLKLDYRVPEGDDRPRFICKDKNFRTGHESLETRLFKEREIPWDDLAFSVVREVLRRYFEDFLTGVFPFHMGDILPEMSY